MAIPLSVVLFAGFELLDVVGPIELLSRLPEDIEITVVGPTAGPVPSGQGTEILATVGYDDAEPTAIAMVPGGPGTRPLVHDEEFLEWLSTWAARADLVTSVCTGSALLAAAGLLEGHRATSNKRAFEWAASHGSNVEWVPKARWVHDRTRWTSSGVAAGMDMTAALIASILGDAAAERAAEEIELELHRDADWDPFAKVYGLA